MNIIEDPEEFAVEPTTYAWLRNRREETGQPPTMTSRDWDDLDSPLPLLRDVAFNRHTMNDGHHVSPADNGMVQVGADGIIVKLVSFPTQEEIKTILSKATRATIGLDLSVDDDDERDWEEMLKGGLQTALEAIGVVFEVSGVSRTCTHQLVRSRRAAFHQQSQRASYYGDRPEARMPESVWKNERAREAWLIAKQASDHAYRVATEEDISYQDARYIMLEGTTNYIMCEYTLREFINVFAYRGCSMFSWEIVHVMREMRRVLLEVAPWLAPYIMISCEKVKRCTFMGWEQPVNQCDFPWVGDRTFKPEFHEIKQVGDAADKQRTDDHVHVYTWLKDGSAEMCRECGAAKPVEVSA